MKKILITGGAGFIGSHLAEKLQAEDYEITILDNFSPQIHGNNKNLTLKLEGKVRLITGDVTDEEAFLKALSNQDFVIHLAAETGTGQSMYQISRYNYVNGQGTAFLCDYLVNGKHHIEKVIVASSRAIYGEGKYLCGKCGIVYPEPRPSELMKKGIFDPVCPVCSSENMKMLPTGENSIIHPASIYGITKQMQEELVMVTCRSTGLNCYSLRYQNVYGPGQSLKNPYTGILSIFSRLAFNNEEINIFEDGMESRDFVYIEDAVDATIGCLKHKEGGQYALNVGSGEITTVLTVVQSIISNLNSQSKITISGDFREGDIRHNIADLKLIKSILDYNPKWKFQEGLKEFLKWVRMQNLKTELPYNRSLQEMKNKGLYHNKI